MLQLVLATFNLPSRLSSSRGGVPLIACEQGWECFFFPALCFGGSGPQDPQHFCVQVDCQFWRPLLGKSAAVQSARARRHHERPCQGLGCVPVPLLPGRLFSHPRPMSSTSVGPEPVPSHFSTLRACIDLLGSSSWGCGPRRGSAQAVGLCWPRCILIDAAYHTPSRQAIGWVGREGALNLL